MDTKKQYEESYDGLKPDYDHCAAITTCSATIPSRQCRFNKGFGPDKSFCKRHANMIEKGTYIMGVIK